jgi:hypothetical protein
MNIVNDRTGLTMHARRAANVGNYDSRDGGYGRRKF